MSTPGRRRLRRRQEDRDGPSTLTRLRAAAVAHQVPSRAPFVVLVVALLTAGLLALLALNTRLNQGEFKLTKLQQDNRKLSDQAQLLRGQIDAWAAPDALASRAAGLGMVPGGSPAFLAPDGTVRGVPAPAPKPSRAPRPTHSASPTHSATPTPGASPTGSASATPTTRAGATASPGASPTGSATATPTAGGTR